MKNKTKIIIGIISLIIIFVAAKSGYSIYKKQQMNELVKISNEFFEEYIKKDEAYYTENNMKATYTTNEIVIIAGDKNEFLSLVYFEIDVDVNGEKEYKNLTHSMRIKRDKDGNYKLIGEDNTATVDGLETVNYSNKQKEKEDLEKTKKEIETNEFEKTAGIYYVIKSDGIQLSYDKKKTWVDVPIPNAFAISNISDIKLKENTYYISHKKTAFISTNNVDIMITITDDKGKTWNKIILPDEYKGGDLFIGFSSDQIGYYVVTTDVAMGKQNSYINITTDGGKTWKEIGNTNEVNPRVITGAGFIDDKIGFVGFRYEDDNNPTVYRTDDAGATWIKLDIKLPNQYSSDYATPMSVKVEGDNAILPVKLRDNDKVIKFITKDKGLTWEYSGANS